jgi:hypothetical protein
MGKAFFLFIILSGFQPIALAGPFGKIKGTFHAWQEALSDPANNVIRPQAKIQNGVESCHSTLQSLLVAENEEKAHPELNEVRDHRMKMVSQRLSFVSCYRSLQEDQTEIQAIWMKASIMGQKYAVEQSQANLNLLEKFIRDNRAKAEELGAFHKPILLPSVTESNMNANSAH